MVTKKALSLPEARELAENLTRESWGEYCPENTEKLLSDEIYEGNSFWIFYKRADIELPAEAVLQRQFTFLITKFGESMYVRDYRHHPERLKANVEGLEKKLLETGGWISRSGPNSGDSPGP